MMVTTVTTGTKAPTQTRSRCADSRTSQRHSTQAQVRFVISVINIAVIKYYLCNHWSLCHWINMLLCVRCQEKKTDLYINALLSLPCRALQQHRVNEPQRSEPEPQWLRATLPGSPPQVVTICDNLWQTPTGCDNLWQPLKTICKLWQPVTSCDKQWQPVTHEDFILMNILAAPLFWSCGDDRGHVWGWAWGS